MKTNPVKLLLVALLSTFIFHPSSLLGQGALTPPGAPAPTMKTLTQVEPRTAITNANSTYTIGVPGSYYLTTNLTVSSGNGITISSGNVTLDLNGFVLQGVVGSSSGVLVSGSYTNITVRNGTITGWGSYGVNASLSSLQNILLERLNVSTNGFGLAVFDGTVRDCRSASNYSTGIYIVRGMVSDCVAHDNGGYGIKAEHSTVRECHVRNNTTCGIYADHSTVSGCYVSDNVLSGIIAVWPDCQIIGNNCFSNNTSGTSGYAGIDIDDSNNRVEDNHVTASGYAGIQVSSSGYSNNIIVKNTVIGTNNYITPGNQVVGPLITNTVSGVITNSNPWANFSF